MTTDDEAVLGEGVGEGSEGRGTASRAPEGATTVNNRNTWSVKSITEELVILTF